MGERSAADGIEFESNEPMPIPTAADLAPAAVAVRNASVVASDLVLKRDIYYTQYPGRVDYGIVWEDRYPRTPTELFDFLSDPTRFPSLANVRSQEYEIGPDRFFMLGDNSPCSKDSRGWGRSDSAWDESDRKAWEVPRAAPDRQGVLCVLAARGSDLARHRAHPRFPHSVPALCRTDEVDPLIPTIDCRQVLPGCVSFPTRDAIKEDRAMPLLQVRGLEKWYGRRQVVNGVDYEVERGEVVGLLGPNGAGKTTSFRMTIGLIDADGGKVMFDGRDVTRLPMYLRARAGMGYLAQDSSVFRQLSVEDNLMAILETRTHMSRKQRKDRQNELLDQFGLTKIRKTKANRVSGGERRRLEIARSLITEPKMIMLDEPFAGIDPKTVAEIQDQIRDLVERYNIGILLTDHQFRETLEVTDRCYLIREGRVFAYGNREQILNNPDVRRHYIGERFDVGHLLDRRRPVSIPQSAPVSDPPANDLDPAVASLPALPYPFVTTELILSTVDEVTVELTETQVLDPEEQGIDPNYPFRAPEGWD